VPLIGAGVAATDEARGVAGRPLVSGPGEQRRPFLGVRASHKPPTLLEISGPLFMSYPVISHLQYRLTAEGGVTRLKLLHRAIGQIPPDHRDAFTKGMEPWSHSLMKVREVAERRKGAVGGNR